MTTEESAPVRGAAGLASAIRDRVFSWRDRMLASPRFIRHAEAFALTRPIARREAAALFDLCSGFVYSQVLAASVKLKLCEALSDGPATPAGIASAIGLTEDAAGRLLTAASALRLAEPRGHGRFGLGGLGAALLASPGLAAMVEHHGLLYLDLADPVELLRDNTAPCLAEYWPYAGNPEPELIGGRDAGDYTGLMASTQRPVAREVLDAVSLKQTACLMDIGGGNGTFLVEAARRHHRLRLMLFDLPAVAEMAAARFGEAGLNDRATATGGSFLAAELPRGADAVSLIRILLDHDDATALAILKAAHMALPPSGMLIVAEPMAGTRAAPRTAAYFSFYLLAMGRGRPRTVAQLRALMTRAGFRRIRQRATRQPLLTQILVARA